MSAGYAKTKAQWLQGAAGLLGGTLKMALIDTGAYTPSYAVDEFLTDVPGGAVIAPGVVLASPAAAGGVLDAETPIVWTGVAGGVPDVGAGLLYLDSGSPATSRLVWLHDTEFGLPLQRAGNDVQYRVDPGPLRLFRVGSAEVPEATCEQFLSGGLDLLSVSVRAILLKSGAFAFDRSAHSFLSDVPAPALLTAGVALSGRAVSGGDFTASPVTFTSVADGDEVGSVLVYVHTGTAGTSRIVSVVGSRSFPRPTNGNDFVWTPGKIVRL